jgi:precorrin-6B methylase 2
MRILFLDDDMARHRWANLELWDHDRTIVQVLTAVDAIDFLSREGSPFDVVFLGHGDGWSSVVDWVTGRRLAVGKFVVHSTDKQEAEKLVAALQDAGHHAGHVPFTRLIQLSEDQITAFLTGDTEEPEDPSDG